MKTSTKTQKISKLVFLGSSIMALFCIYMAITANPSILIVSTMFLIVAIGSKN